MTRTWDGKDPARPGYKTELTLSDVSHRWHWTVTRPDGTTEDGWADTKHEAVKAQRRVIDPPRYEPRVKLLPDWWKT